MESLIKMTQIDQQQIIYFPYLCFQYDLINFEGMILWNFDRERNKLIPNTEVRNYIEKLLNANTAYGRPLQNMAVFSEKEPIFKFSRRKMKLATELRYILFLCVVADRNIHQGENAGHYMATSENFTHVFQNFKLGGEFTAISSGSIVRKDDLGYEIGKVTYEKPPYVLQGNYRIDKALIAALKAIKRRDRKAYRRILMSVDAFMGGYYNSHESSYESRILQQSRAFEILLQLPEGKQRQFFKEKVKFYCLPRNKKFHRRIRYSSERPGGARKTEVDIITVMWADRFYTLRNHIIHGDNIKKGDYFFKSQRHWDISLWVYLVIVKKIINESLGKRIFYDQILWQNGRFEYDRGDIEKWVEKCSKKFQGRL